MGIWRYSSNHSELHYHRQLGGWLYALAFSILGTETHSTYSRCGWVHLKTSRDISGKEKSLAIALNCTVIPQ